MDHSGPAGYNYVYFDQYVAAGADGQDEDAFRASFHAGDPAEFGRAQQIWAQRARG